MRLKPKKTRFQCATLYTANFEHHNNHYEEIY